MKKLIFPAIVIFLLAVVHLYLSTEEVNLGYKISRLRTEAAELRNENRLLASTATSMESLSRIERIAQEKIKMVWPEEITYLVPTAEAGGAFRTRASATPATPF